MSSRLDKLMSVDGGNIAESVGARNGPTLSVIDRHSPPALDPTAARLRGVTRSRDAVVIPLDRIEPDPNQPRTEFDGEALARLAESMKARGQLQPIRVRWDEPNGVYVVVVGERRLRAAHVAGMTGLTCVVMEGPVTESELLMIQLVENALREDLGPMEQARAYKALMDANGWSQRDLARELSVSQSMVAEAMILVGMAAPIQARVEDGQIPPSVARQIATLDDPDAQVELAERVVTEGLSRAETIEAVRTAKAKTGSGAKGRGVKAKKVTVRKFTRAAGCTVTIENPKGLDLDVITQAMNEVLNRVDAERGHA